MRKKVKQQHAGDDDQGGNDGGRWIKFARRAHRAGLWQGKFAALERKGEGLVEQHREAGVQAALEQVKRQKYRQQHGRHRFAGIAHIEGRDDVIPCQHEQGHQDDACTQANDGIF